MVAADPLRHTLFGSVDALGERYAQFTFGRQLVQEPNSFS